MYLFLLGSDKPIFFLLFKKAPKITLTSYPDFGNQKGNKMVKITWWHIEPGPEHLFLQGIFPEHPAWCSEPDGFLTWELYSPASRSTTLKDPKAKSRQATYVSAELSTFHLWSHQVPRNDPQWDHGHWLITLGLNMLLLAHVEASLEHWVGREDSA